MTVAFLSGLTMSLGLIVAIGAQNAFVLRQGLRNEHVFAVCLTCALSDAVLVTLGVAGFGRITALFPWLEPVMRYGGAAFLLWYAARSLRSALRSEAALTVTGAPPATLRQVVLACLAITWLNPHVYLDTVVLLGSVSTQFAGERPAFAAGAVLGSVMFFFTLGYGARLLRPVFARPGTWRLVDGFIALVMVVIAVGLLRGT
ncbi:amino acid transporter [Haematobacter missouriensis]|uniref:Amino acid transporter n=1 Tax=Haematobacter missouriensis TaxID=366616 RepID=A0A212AQ71_9RHOB|nr:LysE/ArgO family amino acid transporter [Haematobacter missouriensis]KFI30197.1 amino acid transporter [Haematobacter missouriensis]OWJ74535.1 amino acid transporter [Haematobacter missouriensis]OWJ83641.1 amino acid transporter [Haematobacter missouriensis]